MLEPLRAGYVAIGSSFYQPDRLTEISARAEAELRDAGIELIRTDPVFSLGQEERAIRELDSEDWDFLMFNVINWVEYRSATRLLLAFRDRPIVLYSYGGFTEGSVLISPAAGAGSTALRFPLEQWGVKFRYLFNGPDMPLDVAGVVGFGRAAQAAGKLTKARVGLIGWNDMGLYTTGFNPTLLRGSIGPEVESIDLLQVANRMDSISDHELARETERVTRNWEYPVGEPSDTTITQAIRLYMATVSLCEEKSFSAVSYKSVEGISSCLGVLHSIPSSLVATAGYPYIDENDVGNLVAELMLSFLSGEPVTFLEHYEHHPEWILLGVDGFIPDQLIDGKPQIKRSTIISEGIAHCSRMKTGRMTLACLSESGGGYRMHIVTGEGRTPPDWVEMGTDLPPWPSLSFYPDVDVRTILDHVQSQHFAAVFGTYVDELRNLCYLLDIEAVVDQARPAEFLDLRAP